MTIKALDLVSAFRIPLAEKWGYIWGKRGQVQRMKRGVFIALLVMIMLPLIALPLIDAPEWSVAGRIRTGDIRAEIMTIPGASCDCCPTLWNGGIVRTNADMTPVQLYDMAEVYTLDGGHYVLECVEITPCIRVKKWLVGWRGMVKAQGDIIVYSDYTAYRFTML